MLILDKTNLRIKISLEYWENVCESLYSTIQDGKIACKKTWFASESLLSFLDLPLMDPIEDSFPPKIKLEYVEREFSNTKDRIEQLDHLHVAEFKEWIGPPLNLQMRINLFL